MKLINLIKLNKSIPDIEIKNTDANILGISNWYPDSIIRYARPLWPEIGPITNSPTTAPINARPLLTFKPDKKKGNALGITTYLKTWYLFAPYNWTSSKWFFSVPFSPDIVFAKRGKKATRKAQTRVASSELLTQIEIKGAIAIMGVTWSVTVISIIDLSAKKKKKKIIAKLKLIIIDKIRAVKAILRVVARELKSK